MLMMMQSHYLYMGDSSDMRPRTTQELTGVNTVWGLTWPQFTCWPPTPGDVSVTTQGGPGVSRGSLTRRSLWTKPEKLQPCVHGQVYVRFEAAVSATKRVLQRRRCWTGAGAGLCDTPNGGQ